MQLIDKREQELLKISFYNDVLLTQFSEFLFIYKDKNVFDYAEKGYAHILYECLMIKDILQKTYSLITN